MTTASESRDGIAIVGLAGRFPGARNVSEFWDNICGGIESITEIDAALVSNAPEKSIHSGVKFVSARGLLPDVDRFDAAFFGMHAREAELTDPQHRILLETCWEALEDAGYDPATSSGTIGIYAGSSISTYMLRHVLGDRAAVETFARDYQVGSFPVLLGGGSDFLATRIAYKLDLRGPAMTVQSACSTSLLAVAQACQALWQRQADMMLAGAVSISFPQERGYLYQDGGMVSSDGHCRTFDAAASGTVFGAGAGIVVLKRLAEARADGDQIYAVIRGTGINNDGAGKIGYTAPSLEGQAAAIVAAQRMARFDPGTIGFVECHGTATPLGDPIEVGALAAAFAGVAATGKRCILGSVKPNVGHLDVAAGMPGLMKAALAVRHGIIPPTLHFKEPNPRIDFASTPFDVAAAATEWRVEPSRRRAGVSSFGVGGTNVHIVLEDEPAPSMREPDRGAQLLVLSARSEGALLAARKRLRDFLIASPQTNLGDVAFTLQTGRRAFPFRAAFPAVSIPDAIDRLAGDAADAKRTAGDDPAIGFIFPGQGTQYVGMGRDLYNSNAVFRTSVDRCSEIVKPILGQDLRELLYPANESDVASQALMATCVAQPAIFTVAYALAQVWRAWGIEAAAMLGHSVGEFVAATLAGVFTLEDALCVVTTRGRLMEATPDGTMLAVRLQESEIGPLLTSGLAIAAINAPKQVVVSGPTSEIVALEAELAKHDAIFKRIATSHAFHSPLMDSVLAPLAKLVASMKLSAPTQPYVSTVTGSWIEPSQAISPAYWAGHARATVRFADAVATLADSGIDVLLEVGPGSSLSAAARQCVPHTSDRCILSSLEPASERREDVRLLRTLGRLWVAGVQPNWAGMRGVRDVRRISLPTYPFEPTRFWLDAPLSAPASPESRNVPMDPVPTNASTLASSAEIQLELAELLEELSGETVERAQFETSFLELGFDSLFLGRFVQKVNARFGVTVTFRQLLSALPSIASLAQHLLPSRPERRVAEPSLPVVATTTPASPPAGGASAYAAVFDAQLRAMQELMREQLQVLAGMPPSAATPTSGAQAPAPAPAQVHAPAYMPASKADEDAGAARFDAFRIVGPAVSNDITPAQRSHIDALVARVSAATPKSKAYAQRYRSVLADPRVAAGFRAEWKEMVYPIVCDRAAGSRLWDIDGNEYIDILNGFGQTAFGHSPDFVVQALREQLSRGFAIGPQTDLAGEVAELFCRMTGNERVSFCNTGSEAVMAALRVARTVTGRDRVIIFGGAYHGQFDEVLVKSARSSERSIPIAPGIPTASVSNITVLPYGAPESLSWIREHQDELAAVVVEPVQSRHPALAPKAFLRELREITATSGTALVFDEVVTGFRMHPGGLQMAFGIRADLATYGKVAGGGMPIGIIAGTARFMDALDGGMWQYGDDSVPEVPPTFFAGTFVRHPLVMASVLAVLRHLDAQGPALQDELTARTVALVERLNVDLERRGLLARIETYGSLFYFNFSSSERLAGLLYYHLRARGIYIQEGFPCFLTTAHTDADVDAIVRAFRESFDELGAAGIFATQMPVNAGVDVPLTEEQKEVWLVAQLGDEASCAFNESLSMYMRGPFDSAAFAQALNDVIARHEALRASFGPTGEVMRIAARQSIAYDTTDVSDRDLAEAEATVAEVVDREARTPFDLVAGPLVRGHLLHLPGEAHVFVFTVHHIAADGWSINVILTELAASYTARCGGRSASLPRPLSFRSYAEKSGDRDPADVARIERYWHGQFVDPVRALDLPTDRPRPAVKTFNGATQTAWIERDEYIALKRAGARNGCTLFVTLLAGFSALIGRLGQRDDVVIGVPAAGQALLDDEILVGHCVDFLPIRTRWASDARFSDLLETVRKRVLDAYEHQDYTLGTLVRTLAPSREANRIPLTEIQFNLERVAEGIDMTALAVDVVPNPKAYVNFDLFFNIIESDDGLRIDCDYNSGLFDAATIAVWLLQYRSMLRAIVSDSNLPVRDATYDDPRPLGSVLSVLDGGASAYSSEATVVGLFEARVAAAPNAIAATCGDVRLTYAELDERANRLANYLTARCEGAEKLVGIALDRSLDMLVALIATWKAGCAYVPLDPKHPPARLRHILEESGVVVLVADGSADVDLISTGIPTIHMELEADAIVATSPRTLEPRCHARSLAYVIYTSGSTGRPKGVEIEQRSLVNLLEAMANRPGLTADDILLAVTTISFDIAALEMFLPLIVGGTVAIATTEEIADGALLLERLRLSRATAMQATPALWRVLLEAGFRSEPGFAMLCGGEPLRDDVAVRLLEGDGELWNMYGPTETTIWSSCSRVVRGQAIAVGTPIANTQFYVLDSNDRIVPQGAIGQLHIGGDGLARGYLKRPDLSADVFIDNPFGPGRIYRTGDSARLLANGELEILGRVDQQVKVRGFRVELGEIESVLAQVGGVAASAVLLREDVPGQPRLVGYYVDRAGCFTSHDEVRSRLGTRLPEYMIPSLWVKLDTLPLTGNGKLDRAALPAPALQSRVDENYAAPQSPLEISLAKIWAEVLGIDRVGTHDDIFALGADSIHFFAITARANRQGIELLAKHLFKHRTIALVARQLESKAALSSNDASRLAPRANVTALR